MFQALPACPFYSMTKEALKADFVKTFAEGKRSLKGSFAPAYRS
jgi:hypothetical protein